LILTAAHCVYDDANKAFARNVIFIPNQDETSGAGTDRDCSNDPLGCWTTRFGVVDKNWTTSTFPGNIPWDYAFYVVDDVGSHTSGLTSPSTILDAAAKTLAVSFNAPSSGQVAHALGYSYSDDPNFMYCAEALDAVSEAPANWWLGSCGLSGGSSGGPWVQPLTNGTGPQFSVNSWGYSSTPGMAGPKLNGTSANCLFDRARATTFSNVATTDGNAGIVIDPASCP
jgi:hypothetical protein